MGGASTSLHDISETVFLNFQGAQEWIQRSLFRQSTSLAGRYHNPIPTLFLALIDCLKITALNCISGQGVKEFS
jgi:hypothetical protein